MRVSTMPFPARLLNSFSTLDQKAMSTELQQPLHKRTWARAKKKKIKITRPFRYIFLKELLIFFMYLSWKKWFILDVPISDVISWGNNQKSFKGIWEKKGGSKRKKKHDRVQKEKKGKKEQQSNHQKTCEVWEAKSYVMIFVKYLHCKLNKHAKNWYLEWNMLVSFDLKTTGLGMFKIIFL